TVMDIVYNPLETRLLKEAREAGCRTVRGVEMFLQQAVGQFELWTRQAAPVEVMRSVLEGELKPREGGRPTGQEPVAGSGPAGETTPGVGVCNEQRSDLLSRHGQEQRRASPGAAVEMAGHLDRCRDHQEGGPLRPRHYSKSWLGLFSGRGIEDLPARGRQ